MTINIEMFCCSGGMARGFRDAGIEFDIAIEFAKEHCDSYEANMGHRPMMMDVRDLLRLVRLGARLSIDLLVADPPCTPWSRAGLRKGTSDDRDMLEETCEIIAELRPRRYLIGNVPGLDDSNNLPTVQRLIGALSRLGYCTADFVQLDAANYGVPQHRIRPFWFGHLHGPCIQWPAPTHCDPVELTHPTLPGVERLLPWVTCRDALKHLQGADLGRPVRMRERAQNGKQHGSVPDRPARVVGTSNLSDGNVLTRHDVPVHTSNADEPARAITTQCRAPGHATTLVLNAKHPPADMDEPSPTIGAKQRTQGGQVLLTRPIALEVPASEKRKRGGSTQVPQSQRVMDVSRPSMTIQARPDRQGSGACVEWPWDRPSTTVCRDERIPPPGHHDANSYMSDSDAILLSERAVTILQGFPEDWVFAGKTKKTRWSQIGQAMPPPLAAAVARSVAKQDIASQKVAHPTGVRDADHLAAEATDQHVPVGHDAAADLHARDTRVVRAVRPEGKPSSGRRSRRAQPRPA